MTGFEPATSWSQTTRSTKLSYTPHFLMNITHRDFSHAESWRSDRSTKLSYTPDFMMNIMRRHFSHAETWPKRSVAARFLRDAYHDMPLYACENCLSQMTFFSRSITLKK